MGCFGGRNEKCTVQRRARFSSIVDMVLAIIGIVASGTDLDNLFKLQEDTSKTQLEKDDASKTIYIIFIVLIINIIKLVMGYTLWHGAMERNYNHCRSWLIVSFILWILQLASFIVKLAIGTFVLTSTISTSLALLGRIFAMKAVYTFLNELTMEQKLGGFIVVES